MRDCNTPTFAPRDHDDPHLFDLEGVLESDEEISLCAVFMGTHFSSMLLSPPYPSSQSSITLFPIVLLCPHMKTLFSVMFM